MIYGIPYVGSKNRMAKDILNVLPTGKRLVDLFGGGGAITHCASIEYPDKWESILYNDKNKLIADVIKDCINGTLEIPREFITREEFKKQKDNNGVIAIMYSYSGNLISYTYSRKNEDIKHQMHDYVVFNKGNNFGIELNETEVNKRRLEFQRKYKKKYNSRLLFHHLSYMNRLKNMPSLKNVEVANMDYTEYKYKKGDIVYCDIPYETRNTFYTGSFNNEDFYRWANEQPFDVYVSNYQSELAEKYGGKKIWEKELVCSLNIIDGVMKRNTEIVYLF